MQDSIMTKEPSRSLRDHGCKHMSSSTILYISKDITNKQAWYPISHGSEMVSPKHPLHLYALCEDVANG